MYPDFYPIFQVLNASLVKEQSVYTELCHWNQTIILNVELQILFQGLSIFLFMGIGSKRFRIVLKGGTPDGRVNISNLLYRSYVL